ncbi:hypothetical protein SKAU_G00122610 [Synaphobranchus kaupii]|uniref:Uncharacterized protein n=1 Tax=Synaphobranchus kaupii TaxID=118154 RepID=A0A9Q1FNV8_SYNKA|nr:hypothetical protein SKAU_G00122610 [Synaphobranchus kaupii]
MVGQQQRSFSVQRVPQSSTCVMRCAQTAAPFSGLKKKTTLLHYRNTGLIAEQLKRLKCSHGDDNNNNSTVRTPARRKRRILEILTR